jgi:hypothetical protein
MGHQRFFQGSQGSLQNHSPKSNKRAHHKAQGRPRKPLCLGPGETTLSLQTTPQGQDTESSLHIQPEVVCRNDNIENVDSRVQGHHPQLGSHNEPVHEEFASDSIAHEKPIQAGLDQNEPSLEVPLSSLGEAIHDFDNSLFLIFAVFKLRKISLRSFLLDLLESTHPYIMHQMSMFFGKGSAAEILGEWQLYCYHRKSWDGHLARAAANYATDRMQRELKRFLDLKEDVPEPDSNPNAVAFQQKRKRLDEQDIMSEDLGLMLTSEERTFFGAATDESGSTNPGTKVMSDESSRRADSGAVDEEGVEGVSQEAGITSRESGVPTQRAAATSPGLLTENRDYWINHSSKISTNGSKSTLGKQGKKPRFGRVTSQRPTHIRVERQLIHEFKRNSTKSFFRRPAVTMT